MVIIGGRLARQGSLEPIIEEFMVIIATGSRLGVPPLPIPNREVVKYLEVVVRSQRVYGDYSDGVQTRRPPSSHTEQRSCEVFRSCS
jgi:hypothetical protein